MIACRRWPQISRPLALEHLLYALVAYCIVLGSVLGGVDDRGIHFLVIYLSLSFLAKISLGRHMQIATLTIPGFFYTAYIALFVIPSVIIYNQMVDPIREKYLVSSLSILLLFPCGVLFGHFIASIITAPRNTSNYAMAFCDVTNRDMKLRPVIIGAYFFSIIIGIVYCSYLEVVPVLKIFRDFSSIYDEKQLRFMFELVPPIVAFAFAFCRIVVIPTCLMYLYILKQHGIVSSASFWLYTAGGAILASVSLDRGPVLIIFVMLAIADCLASPGIFLNRRTYGRSFGLLMIGILIVAIISAAQTGEVTTQTYAQNIEHVIAKRIFLSPATVASSAFQATPGPDFLGGRYIRIITFITTGEYIKGSAAPPLVILPCGFMADLWRNWGSKGIAIGAIVFGAYAQVFQTLAFVRKTLTCVIAQAFFLLGMLWLIPGNAIGAITTTVLLVGGMGSVAARLFTQKSSSYLVARIYRRSWLRDTFYNGQWTF